VKREPSNSDDLAVALGYRPEIDGAPRVIATGRGPWAERIRQLAREHGIAVREDDDLTDLLSQLPLASEIPEELYPAVAEILAFLIRLSNQRAVQAR